MDLNENDNRAQWGVLELMGRKIVAGLISSETSYGEPLLRIDVPATSAHPEFTQLYGGSSVYCLTFVSEDVARMTAEKLKVNPISVYMPELVTREALDEVVKKYQEKIELLRNALPEPAHEERVRVEYEEDGDDDDEGEDGAGF